MTPLYIIAAAAVFAAVRIWFRIRRRRSAGGVGLGRSTGAGRWRHVVLGEVGAIAGREIHERVRGRFFRVGTLVMLLAVAAAIVIPSLHKHSSGLTLQRVGVVGGLSPAAGAALRTAAASNSDRITLQPEPSLASARDALRAGRIDLAIVDSDQIILGRPASSKDSSADSGLVSSLARYLGVLQAYRAAGLSASQAARVSAAKPVPVHALEAGTTGASSTTTGGSIIGLVLLFLMLNQYDTWILMGVMQEKSSRVVEVLLATVRPLQLLGGKVLGIGLVAFGQATVIVAFAFALAEATGSGLLRGAEPLALLSELLWLLLGYAFYCWVYAAAGSTAERQDQVQTLVLPLSIPIIIAYVFSLTVVSSGQPDLFFKILAYVPLTAPFCMSVLVALRQVTWWAFVLSALLTVASTGAMAVFAAGIYRRAVLRTGARVHVRELLRRPAR